MVQAITEAHGELIRSLRELEAPSWAERVLLSCLTTLESRGRTETARVRVADAWVGPGDQVSVVYLPPWAKKIVGLRRIAVSNDVWTYPDYDGPDAEFTAEQFGAGMAIWDLGEPMGLPESSMWRDSQGLYWWGDLVADPPGEQNHIEPSHIDS